MAAAAPAVSRGLMVVVVVVVMVVVRLLLLLVMLLLRRGRCHKIDAAAAPVGGGGGVGGGLGQRQARGPGAAVAVADAAIAAAAPGRCSSAVCHPLFVAEPHLQAEGPSTRVGLGQQRVGGGWAASGRARPAAAAAAAAPAAPAGLTLCIAPPELALPLEGAGLSVRLRMGGGFRAASISVLSLLPLLKRNMTALRPMLCWVLQFRRGRGQGVAMPGERCRVGGSGVQGANWCSECAGSSKDCKMGLIRDQRAVSFVQLQPPNSRRSTGSGSPVTLSHSSLGSLPGELGGNPTQCQHAPDRGWCRQLRYCDCGTGRPMALPLPLQ